LLKILSNTKEVTNINEFLNKVFENVGKLGFDEEKIIRSMSSKEGEKIPILDPVDPRDMGVESWMKDVEGQMVDTVRKVMLDAISS